MDNVTTGKSTTTKENENWEAHTSVSHQYYALRASIMNQEQGKVSCCNCQRSRCLYQNEGWSRFVLAVNKPQDRRHKGCKMPRALGRNPFSRHLLLLQTSSPGRPTSAKPQSCRTELVSAKWYSAAGRFSFRCWGAFIKLQAVLSVLN